MDGFHTFPLCFSPRKVLFGYLSALTYISIQIYIYIYVFCWSHEFNEKILSHFPSMVLISRRQAKDQCERMYPNDLGQPWLQDLWLVNLSLKALIRPLLNPIFFWGGYVRWGGGWLAMKDLRSVFYFNAVIPKTPWRGQVKNRALKKFDWRVPKPYFFGCFGWLLIPSIQRRHIFEGLAVFLFFLLFFSIHFAFKVWL